LSKAAGEQLQCDKDPNGPDLETCMNEAHQKGYDKPIFYFAFSTAAHPSTLYTIFREERRNAIHELIGQYGNWPQINQYRQLLNQIDNQLENIGEQHSSKSITKIQKAVNLLQVSSKDAVILSQLVKIESAISDTLLAAIKPYGMDNQYHFWITNFLTGNFGISHRDSIPVIDKIKAKLPWTLYINIPAILLAYLISIPLGTYSAIYRGTRFDKIVHQQN